jgi:3-phosphoglycerate kinase
MHSKLSLRDLSVGNQRVLVRVDFNVPLSEQGQIVDDTRIVEALPTIRYLLEHDAKVILMAHLGRPKTGINQSLETNKKYSLAPIAKHLESLLRLPVQFSSECIGPVAKSAISSMKNGMVLLLENVRFHKEEESNDPSFAAALGELGDLYINDAFGAAHRAHASTAGITRHIRQSAMGFLMEKEMKYLQVELKTPEHPFLVILGGSKVSDKIGVIKALMAKADTFLIGGAMAYTFLKATGIETARSRVEVDKIDLAKELLEEARKKSIRFLLPIDCIATQAIEPGVPTKNVTLSPLSGISEGWEGVDIGLETRLLYAQEIARAKTILWNGPVGIFEIPDFSGGTRALAEAIAGNRNALSIIGGGDSVTAVKQFGLANLMSFLSTGGGASLELIEGKELPGIAALTDFRAF